MTTPNYTDSLPTFKLTHTAPNGREFSYTVTRLTLQCYLFEADHTGVTRQFATAAALHRFWSALKAHLNTVYAVKLLPAYATAAIETPTTEHVIRIDEMVDTPVAVDPAERIRQLRRALTRAAVRKSTSASFKKIAVWLKREIKRYETQGGVQQHVGSMYGEYYHHADLELALTQFERKYGRKATHLRISKYDHIAADTIADDIEVARSGAVLPGDCWIGAQR